MPAVLHSVIGPSESSISPHFIRAFHFGELSYLCYSYIVFVSSKRTSSGSCLVQKISKRAHNRHALERISKLYEYATMPSFSSSLHCLLSSTSSPPPLRSNIVPTTTYGIAESNDDKNLNSTRFSIYKYPKSRSSHLFHQCMHDNI